MVPSVLIVDDEKHTREGLQQALSDNYDVTVAANADEACDKVVELLNREVAPQSIWDALFDAAGELLMRRPGIVSLHAVTTTNALHFAFQQSANDETRRLLLLQNVAFLPLFRGDLNAAKELHPAYFYRIRIQLIFFPA